MNSISASISSHGIERILAADNLNHFYDSSLRGPDMSAEDRIKLSGYLPYYPIGTYPGGEKTSTYIPLCDYETKFTKHMGLLVSESKIVENMFVIEHLPYPEDTPLPTGILTTFGSKIQYQPIRGFILQKERKKSNRADVMLLVGEEDEKVNVQNRSNLHGGRYLSYLLLRNVNKSKLLNETRLKAEALLSQPNGLTKSLDSPEELHVA
jgi:hypothetical protein